jgi:hypothetical protein
MRPYAAENNLMKNIRARFPVESEVTDRWLIVRGWDPADEDVSAYTWVEAFADRITDAIRQSDACAIRAQTDFLAEEYMANPEQLGEIVDVAYSENIMWNASDSEKVWAWEFIAPEIRQLYEDTWRDPTAV